MPLIHLITTEKLSDGKALCAKLSKLCAEIIGKPEAYVMALAHGGAAMSMAGAGGPAAFVDVRSIGGLSGEVNRRLAERVCGLLRAELGVAPDRVYLNFTSFAAANWGHDGGTFG